MNNQYDVFGTKKRMKQALYMLPFFIVIYLLLLLRENWEYVKGLF